MTKSAATKAGPITHAATPPDVTLPDAPRALRPDRLTETEFARGDFRALIPEGFTYQDALSPSFWKLVAGRFRRGDMIEALNERMTWFARLIVVAVDRPTQTLELREVSFIEIAPARAAAAERKGFTAIDGGLHDGWIIVRDFDNAVMRKNLPSFEEAGRIIQVEYMPLLAKAASGQRSIGAAAKAG
jgi:hypothetical protein